MGDRILVGLALVALVGGALIAVANVLPDADELAQASVAPSEPVRTPRPTPTPSPPRVITVERQDIVTEPIAYPVTFSGWIRAYVDLVIRASPEPDAVERGTLLQGEVAYADQQDQPAGDPGWLALQPPYEGWIASVEGQTQLVQRYQQPIYPTSAYVRSLTAGPDGFVALAWPPGDGFSYQPARPIASLDGATWQAGSSSAFAGSDVVGVAWGPAGWLAASNTNGPNQNEISLWTSHNGLAWSPLGIMAGMQGEYAVQISASAQDYLLETTGNYGGSSSQWSSADRLTWRESVDRGVDLANTGWGRTNALSVGFYRWNADPGVRVAPAFFSTDGENWSAVENGPGGVNRPMASIGDGIVAIDADPETAAPQVWFATVADGTLLWRRDSSADADFAGTVVTQLVTDGETVFAFGWDRSTDEPLMWTRDTAHWQRSSLPESFGGPPQFAAAAGAGVVLAGHRPTLRGDNPIFWQRTSDGDWLAETEPVFELVPDPSTDACPALPADFLAFSVVDHAAALICFGDAPMTFRAWSTHCDGCFGAGPGVPRPEWLMSPTDNQLFLAPTENGYGWSTSVVVDPSLTMDPTWTEAFLEVTGHFDDPAAATCHYEPALEDLVYYSGQQTFIDQCRQAFVVTAVSVVSGL